MIYTSTHVCMPADAETDMYVGVDGFISVVWENRDQRCTVTFQTAADFARFIGRCQQLLVGKTDKDQGGEHLPEPQRESCGMTEPTTQPKG